jgi:2-amino-4-hydroxy-6-hydroxymethyldihydropteridine diphosphokinase
MSIAALALGSNLGDRLNTLSTAIACLGRSVEILRISPVYETAPLYVTDQPAFLNMAILAETDLAPHLLLAQAKRVEGSLGRQPTFRYGPRAIDIDILFLGASIVATDDLVIPHPRLPERRFALAPLADIAPDWRHPVTGLTASEMLDRVEHQGIFSKHAERLPTSAVLTDC